MSESEIDRLYEDNCELLKFLDNNKQVSLKSNVEDNSRKMFLLYAASHFEERLTKSIYNLAKEFNCAEPFIQFINNKAIQRQYHTYFNWDSKNANQLFKLFGDKFKKFMEEKVKSDREFEKAVSAFMELGRLRNEMTHGNIAEFILEKTTDEVYTLYKEGLRFVDTFPNMLREFANTI
ncbi:hypothetical protein MCHI_002917 [Candidatus Magnetoovum chiemensis]|nr:hypothetical protein MCHI_002917 [Candidatus Magnetoovum chiemensis]